MILTIDEKEKLLHKASELYEKIKNINIKNTIELDTPCKYYPNNIRYSNSGFKYYANGMKSMSIHCLSIGGFLEELQNYINYKKYNGEKYINGKYVDCIYYADVLALLDFLYYGESILKKVNEINEKTKRELKSLLD